MNENQTITLQKRLDRTEIEAAALAATPLIIFVANEYNNDLPEGSELDASLFDSDTLEAFMVMTDMYTWQFEALCPVWKVDYDAGANTFSFARSYQRNEISTADKLPLENGTPLLARFEFPGFTINEVVEVTVLFNQDFSVEDKATLLAAGVDVTVDGAAFSFTTIRECKVYFFKPEDTEGLYVVYYPAVGTVIPAT